MFNNRYGGVTWQLPDVTTDSRGNFRVSDTPTVGGRCVYEVVRSSNELYNGASATHEGSLRSAAFARSRRSAVGNAALTALIWRFPGVGWRVHNMAWNG